MNKIISPSFLLLLLLSISPSFIFAQEGLVREKGKATIKYSGIFRAGSEERRIAMDKALVNCIDRYMAQLPKARYEIFLKNALSKVEANPAPYVGNVTIIKEHTDKTTKTFDIIVEAELNVAKLNALLEAMLPQGTLSEDEALMAFVAMGRYLKQRTTNEDQVRSFELIEEAKETTQKEANKLGLKGEELEVFLKEGMNKAYEKINGGNTTSTASVDIRDVQSVGSLDAAINKVFTEAKFEVFDGGDLELDLDQFKSDFAENGEASAATRRAAYKLLAEEEINFLFLASLDVHLPEIDKQTGQFAVSCFVTSKILQLRPSKSGKSVLGLTKASMSGIPFMGLGSNEDQARQNAINIASQNTAEILRDQLRAKGLTP